MIISFFDRPCFILSYILQGGFYIADINNDKTNGIGPFLSPDRQHSAQGRAYNVYFIYWTVGCIDWERIMCTLYTGQWVVFIGSI